MTKMTDTQNLNLCEDCDICTRMNPILADLPEQARKSLMGNSIQQKKKADMPIFKEGDPADSIYIVMHGRVKLSRYDSLGREQIVMILTDGDIIWESMFLDGSVYPYSAISLTDSTICQVHRDDFIKVVDEPTSALNIIILLSRKLHDANERNLLLSTKDPVARLAGFLLYRIDRSIEDDVVLKLDDIAASVNLRAETVSRKLREMEKAGYIERTGQSKIHVIDEEALRDLYIND